MTNLEEAVREIERLKAEIGHIKHQPIASKMLATLSKENESLKAEIEKYKQGFWGRTCSRLSAEIERKDKLMDELKSELGLAEWGTVEHAEELLTDIIRKYHPLLCEALTTEEDKP